MSEEFEVHDVNFKRLRIGDALKLSAMLVEAPAAYSRYFIPFVFDAESVRSVLRKAKKDIYFAIKVNGDWAGFYMLRGFDQGYRIPAYGVWIRPKYENCGLAALTLAHAFAICKLNGIGQVLLKVHPKNVKAVKLYEKTGFIRTGSDPRNSNFIYQKSFTVKKHKAGA
jgi:ribosomal-protein-alanine N-acetyltransferase